MLIPPELFLPGTVYSLNLLNLSVGKISALVEKLISHLSFWMLSERAPCDRLAFSKGKFAVQSVLRKEDRNLGALLKHLCPEIVG
jgi:hypothetical protein